jgi:hypothetical protein
MPPLKSMRERYLTKVNTEALGDTKAAKCLAKQRKAARTARCATEVSILFFSELRLLNLVQRSEKCIKTALEDVPAFLTGSVDSKDVEVDKKWHMIFCKRPMSPMSLFHGDGNDDRQSGYRVTQDGYRDECVGVAGFRPWWLCGGVCTVPEPELCSRFVDRFHAPSLPSLVLNLFGFCWVLRYL